MRAGNENAQIGAAINGYHGTVASQAVGCMPAYCAERHRLTEAFAEAVREFLAWQEKQFESLTRQGQTPYEKELGQARERREAAKAALLSHLAEHGC